MSDSNKNKSLHGASSNQALGDMLKELSKDKILQDYKKEYRNGYPDYSPSQFFAPFMITLNNGEKWLLFLTTSMRTDRIKGNQWDAFNLKAIDSTITFAALVYPDSTEPENVEEFKRQRMKYINHGEFTYIDDIISQRELLTLLEEKYFENIDIGRKLDLRGRRFENQIEYILNNSSNFLKWKDTKNAQQLVGIHYDVFDDIVNAFGLSSNDVFSLSATTNVPKLPSRGNPKTDVLVNVKFVDGSERSYTISCKKTSAKSVSVHEYNADAFADDIDPDNSSLRKLLNEFQRTPSLRDFGEKNVVQLTQALKPYLHRLSLWVLGGHYGPGNPETQWADYIVVNDVTASTISIYGIEAYYQKLLNTQVSGHFGTIFSWTYPSKKHGTKIQLKCKVL